MFGSFWEYSVINKYKEVIMSVQRIERKEYLDKLIAFRDKKLIKVVTGEA